MKNKIGSAKYPLTAVQVEKMFALYAELCKKYGIKITLILAYPKTSSKGKIDITILPSYLSIKPSEVGNFIRKKVKWYYERLK